MLAAPANAMDRETCPLSFGVAVRMARADAM